MSQRPLQRTEARVASGKPTPRPGGEELGADGVARWPVAWNVRCWYARMRRTTIAAEAAFLTGVGTLDVEGPAREDFHRIAELVEQHANFPLGGTDASVVALAERIGASIVITLDRRHLGAVNPRHIDAFELLP